MAGNETQPITRPVRARAASGGGPAMFGRRFRIGSLLGFEIGVDASWVFIALLITWSLAAGLFPAQFPGLEPGTYWIMGLAGSLGLFASVVVHELSHSLVARRHGVEMKGITLFLFGGVAHMGQEPPTPRAEFQVAIIGPITSIVVGALFWAVAQGAEGLGWPQPVTGVLAYLGVINGILAAFNLVPAFPLDGGRVLRAILWKVKGRLRWATRIASRVGAAFGIVLIVLGIVAFISGDVLGGMWWALIGLFLRGAARMSYQQLVVREALEGETVRRFMTTDPVTVPGNTSLRDLVEHYFYRDYHKMYPVMDNGRLAGCITINRMKQVPREEWDRRTVGELAEPCDSGNSISGDTDAVDALTVMQQDGRSRLLVREGDRLLGVVTLRDLLRFLSVRVELGDQ